MSEEWRPVVGYEGFYEVSDLGRVRSLARIAERARSGDLRIRERMLTPSPTGNGLYLTVELWREGSRKRVLVHRIVAFAFLGLPVSEDLTDACHLDGDGLNNAASNLRWDSHAANLRDKLAHGTNHEANKTHCPRGHALVEGNLVRHPWVTKRHRICLTCRRASNRSAAAVKRKG